MPTLFNQLQTARKHEPPPPGSPVSSRASRERGRKMGTGSRTSQARVEVRREFLRTTTRSMQDEAYTNPESLPSLDVAYDTFQRVYPKFAETWAIDDLRDEEYYHLEEGQHVCMDYCGFGLFSYYQQVVNKASASFGLAYISANLPTHALYGVAEEGTAEFYIRKRVMDYLNINDTEYSMVFTASRGSAFKLLAESYPFHVNRKLLTVYDFESDAVNWMADCAKQKGAKVMSACFKWPSLRVGTSHLKKQLLVKKRKHDAIKGLFVFPVQSRLTGAKYSFQWMSQAQQNRWHVLLDASALGPKDMDSLGLSLFRPDFIVSSFYKVFGTDPTGFGCLFIKNSALHILQNSSRARAVGMVRIVSTVASSSNETSDPSEVKGSEEDFEDSLAWRSRQEAVHATSSFSGPFFKGSQVEHSGQLTGHRSDPRSGMGEIEEEGLGSSDSEYESQLTKSRYYTDRRESEIEEEFPNSSGEIGYAPRSRNGVYEYDQEEEEEEEEEEEDNASFGERERFTDSPLRWSGSVTEIMDDDDKLMMIIQSQGFSQSFSREQLSGIEEGNAEGQDPDELGDSTRSSQENNDAAQSNGGPHTSHLHGGGNEIKEEVLAGNYSPNGGREIEQEREIGDVEEIERDVNGEKELRQSLDLRESKREGIGEGNLSAEHEQPQTAERASEVAEVGDDTENWPNAEEENQDAHKQGSVAEESAQANNRESVQSRLESFAGRASFKRHTGKDLSDFQEMGVHGLVQKFQSLRSGSEFSGEMEGSSQGLSDLPLYKRRGSIGNQDFAPSSPHSKSGASPSPPRTVAEAVVRRDGNSMEESGGSADNSEEPVVAETQTGATSDSVPVENVVGPSLSVEDSLALQEGLAGDVLQEREDRLVRTGARIVLNRSPEEEFHSMKSSLSSTEFQILDLDRDTSDLSHLQKSPPLPSYMRSPSFSFRRKVSSDAQSSFGTGSTNPVRGVPSAGEDSRPAKFNAERLPTHVDDDSNEQYSQPFRSDGGTSYDSNEDNYITILPKGGEKNQGVARPKTETSSSGSQELSRQETSFAVGNEILKRNSMPARDTSSPEITREIEHSREEEMLFRSSRGSSTSGLDRSVPSASTQVVDMASPWRDTRGNIRSRQDVGSVDIEEENEPGWGHGRSDLRSNITLSRDVDFPDELLSRRASDASDMALSRRPSTALAEDIAEVDLQDSDDESFYPSQFYSGSIPGSGTSRYVDDMPSASYQEGEEGTGEEGFEDVPEVDGWDGETEPVILCKGLDLADSMGLTKLNYRLRYLINWLVHSLLKLRHPGRNRGIPLIRVYGPKVKYDRGGSVSFNMFDWKGILIQPGLVQRLADRSNISLGVGRLCNIVDPDFSADFIAEKERILGVDNAHQGLADASPYPGKLDGGKSMNAGNPIRIPVVTVSLGFVTSFEDVYKLWSFLAKFLDADFVSKEVWRYHSLNQQTIVM